LEKKMAKQHKRWMKLDPSRTKTERQRFMREVQRRFRWLVGQVVQWLVTDDELGLEEQKPFRLQNKRQYAFLSDPAKLKQFQAWLKQQMDAGVLSVSGGFPGKPWTADYIESAWRKGMLRAYTDVRKEKLTETPEWYRGTKEQWLRSAFAQPEMMSKVELLATRAFEGMKGVTEQMSTQMSRILADGLANGYNPKKVAKLMTDSIGKLTRTRALVIARTEIIHAHAEGMLDGYGMLGVEMVGAEVEWSTSGDSLVCEQCSSLEGKTFTIEEARGKIPLHPSCRCSWKPVVEGEKKR